MDAAIVAAPTAAPSCASCRFYEERHADADAAARATAAGMDALMPPGHCRRFPARAQTRPEDWCGEHRPKEP